MKKYYPYEYQEAEEITANLISHVGYEFASIMALHYRDTSPYLEMIRKNK